MKGCLESKIHYNYSDLATWTIRYCILAHLPCPEGLELRKVNAALESCSPNPRMAENGHCCRRCLNGNLAVRICLPFLFFVDEFGLYRNMYRSLLGIYWIPARLLTPNRQKREAVFTTTLWPYAVNLTVVIPTLRPSWSALDRGIQVKLDGDEMPLLPL